MFIKINDKNRVVMQVADKFATKFTADNKNTFVVAEVPAVNTNEMLCFNPEIKEFYAEAIPEPTEEQKAIAKARAEARAKKAKALKWLADNDWKCNKIIRGEWTTDDPRWIEYLEGATKARQEQDEANAVLNQY